MTEPISPGRIPLTINVTPAQKRQIERLAEQKGLSPEAVVLSVLNRELEMEANGEERDKEPQSESFLDGIEHLVGSVEGPSDLSTNPEHMEGYGRS